MHFQVLIHPKSVQRRSIKTCQEHIYYDQQIYFPLFHFVGQILVVILKSLAGSVKVGLENLIIIVNRHLEKITGTLIQFIGIKTFVL